MLSRLYLQHIFDSDRHDNRTVMILLYHVHVVYIQYLTIGPVRRYRLEFEKERYFTFISLSGDPIQFNTFNLKLILCYLFHSL